MTTELNQPSSATQTLSAGQILRQARELQQLTPAQVAQQLNLSKSLIDDLELDQVDAKLSSTFVRGYLRSYAKLLKIPAQQVLDAYSKNAKELHQVPSLTRSFSKRTAKEATENRFMWVTYFVILVFVVLLVIGFWQSRFSSSSAATALPMAQTDETMQASEDALSSDSELYQSTALPESQIPVTQLDTAATATEVPVQSAAIPTDIATDAPVLPVQQPVAKQSETAVSTPSTVSAPEAVSPAGSELQSETVPVSAGTVVAGTTATSPAALETAETEVTETDVTAETQATASINLSLTAECWVDIVDATGKRLVFGSRQAGEQLNLRGVAPIKVLLGNAAAATLSFNGAAIDLSGYPTGRVARLTLGQN